MIYLLAVKPKKPVRHAWLPFDEPSGIDPVTAEEINRQMRLAVATGTPCRVVVVVHDEMEHWQERRKGIA